MQHKIIKVLIGVFVMTSLQAQEMLIKDEAVKITLENNLGIKIAKNSLGVANNNANLLNSGYLPTITGNAGGSFDRQTTEGELANGETRGADGVETKDIMPHLI